MWDREWQSHADFYQDIYAASIHTLRYPGSTGASILKARQDAGDWSDAPTPDLIITVLTSDRIGLYADQGAGRFNSEMTRGCFIVTPPGTGSTILVRDDHRLTCFAVPYSRLLSLAGPDAGLPADGDFGGLHERVNADAQVPWLLERIWRESTKGGAHGRLWADGAVLQIAARLIWLKDARKGPRRHRGGLASGQARRVTEYIDAHLSHDLTLGELATLVGLSPNHFCTAFRQSFGRPPAAWLQARRIARAQEMMLADPMLGLTEIAHSVGYASQSAFGTAFLRIVGTSPGRWRADHQGG